MPHSAAGMRTEPPVSEPMPPGTMRAPTATPTPPLEPPGMRLGSYGLRAAPKAALWLVMPYASSCRLALPNDERAGVEQLLHDRRVALRAVLAQPRRAAGGRHVGGVEVVLQRERHAVQRAERFAARAPGVGGGAAARTCCRRRGG